jgi:hypothetical protein
VNERESGEDFIDRNRNKFPSVCGEIAAWALLQWQGRDLQVGADGAIAVFDFEESRAIPFLAQHLSLVTERRTPLCLT